MNEFKVWMKDYNKFMHKEMALFGDGSVVVFKEGHFSCILELGEHNLEVVKYIGKTDIEGNKIYADSSIVEFDFKGFGETESAKYKGFIKYNKERFRYDIEVFSHGDKDGDNYIFDLGKCIHRIENIKIIGTLQENPELLEQS